ncbi:MAG: RHS repeat-associated core domain-containing protein [Fimbriimonadaceae bacterium]
MRRSQELVGLAEILRLPSVSSTSGSKGFTYNSLGTRAQVGTRTFLRAGAGVTAGVLDDGNAVYTPGVSEKRGSVTTFSHSGLKNTWAQTDAPASGDASVQAIREYDAFGSPTASSGAWSGPFGYAGQFSYQGSAPADPLGGLHLLGHRYYDPTLGRFLSRDPVGDGSNWYAYCGNSPVGNFDSDGQRVHTLTREDTGIHGRLDSWHDPDLEAAIDQGIIDGIRTGSKGCAEGLSHGWYKASSEVRDKDGFNFSVGAGQLARHAIVAVYSARLAHLDQSWIGPYENGGGGIVIKVGNETVARVEVHPWYDKKRKTDAPVWQWLHYHRRPGIGKHRPWQGGW